MSNAIGLNAVPFTGYETLQSHFFGDPVLPLELLKDFDDEVLFYAFINCRELAEYDPDGNFPHEGYFYIFLDTSGTEYALKPLIFFTRKEPTHQLDDFNEDFEDRFPGINTPVGMAFCSVEEDAPGNKLLGVPHDWNYMEKPGELLLTISHFEEEPAFCPQVDGFTYIFFGPKEDPLGGATAFTEHS